MPELPDVEIYVERLTDFTVGEALEQFRILNPFILRSVAPSPQDLAGLRVTRISRLGKRIVLGFEGDRYVVIHLMIAGRLRWRARGKSLPGKIALAAFDFANGTLFLSEAGSKRRASLHIVEGTAALAAHDRGGIEPLESSREAFVARLRRENHTLKRALADPRLFSGIGNAYSDEILHAARLSPMQLTSRIDDESAERLYDATRSTLTRWIELLRSETGEGFPETVTAFRPEMAVHGKYGQPCPVCSSPVQRIRYADNETNYCARCQTDGRLFADRGLSRLLKSDWPRSIDELE